VPDILSSLPAIRALTLSGLELQRPALTERQRHKLVAVSTRMQVSPRTVIYREGDKADSAFINGGGIIISFRDMPSGKRRVAGFRFAADVFGLAQRGVYANTTRAITSAIVYKLPLGALTELLREDAEIQLQFLCKIVHDVRQQQHRALIVARRDAAGRVAMFIDVLRQMREVGGRVQDLVDIPMTRSDIGDYLNLSLETVSRACRRLSDSGLVQFSPGNVRILDRARFDKLVARL
jgi:CRP/FNR family transcriptional regulator